MCKQGKHAFEISVEIEITMDKRLRKSQFAEVGKHLSYRTGTPNLPPKLPELPRLRFPASAIPKFNGKIARMIFTQQLLQKDQHFCRAIFFFWSLSKNGCCHSAFMKSTRSVLGKK